MQLTVFQSDISLILSLWHRRVGVLMTGSLQIKRDKYYAVLNMYDENHKRKQKWIDLELSSKGNNYRKANQKLNNIMTDIK